MTVTFTWLGHSTFQLESGGKKLIMDPFITNNPLCSLSPNDIEAEYILLTHAHGDHVGFTNDSPAGDTLAVAKNTGATIVANYEIVNWFTAHGVSAEQVWDGNPGGTMRGDWLDVKFTKAFHSSSFGDGSYGGQPNGLIIRTNGVTIYNAGDTDLFGDMQLIGDEGIDVAMLPIGDKYTMGIDDSIKAVKFLRPKYVIPMHYNTWEPLVQDAKAWGDRINRETSAQPVVIDPGQSYTLE